MLTELLILFSARLIAVAAHEFAHFAAAFGLGYYPCISVLGRSTHVPDISTRDAAIVRHVGWTFSVCAALLSTMAAVTGAIHSVCGWALPALWLTALDGIASDLIGFGGVDADTFLCGNFGLLLLDMTHAEKVRQMIEAAIRVTMMRGAQSAGIVTYQSEANGGLKGVRSRVVNGKRTDLCRLLLRKIGNMLEPAQLRAPQIIQGHTRFATSSIAGLPGCHPHQWSPARRMRVWKLDGITEYSSAVLNVEGFITHNGDLDFFTIHGICYPLEELQELLPVILHAKMPASVDSACVAGLFDLLRTRGIWYLSVRYGYVFGALSGAGSLLGRKSHLWSASTLERVASLFESEWQVLALNPPPLETGESPREAMVKRMIEVLEKQVDGLGLTPASAPLGAARREELLLRFVHTAVEAFFKQDLLTASQQLITGAIGSFGLVLTHSADAHNEIVVASRGQTMSVAFYPLLGVAMFASESAATKVGLGMVDSLGTRDSFTPQDLLEGFRFDMDDVNGETVLLHWGPKQPLPRERLVFQKLMTYGRGAGILCGVNVMEKRTGSRKAIMDRILHLGRNPMVQPVPDMIVNDPVGRDIDEIPEVLLRIQQDWNTPSESLNRLTAHTFMRRTMEKLLARAEGERLSRDVDVLVTGCEVSLWLGEQFSSDLLAVFPDLNVLTISANKLLGLLGQGFQQPQTGFSFNNRTHQLVGTVVLLITHSGGTFATLNVANLLKGYTSNIFVVTSEWDTQVARAVRAGPPGQVEEVLRFGSYVFTTFCGLRPAEPCSLTVVATHQVLTQILLYVIYNVREHMQSTPGIGGSDFTQFEVRELESLNLDCLRGISTLTKGTPPRKVLEHTSCLGDMVERSLVKVQPTPTGTREQLETQGRLWAQHVLEGPISWMMSATYILLTVTVGYTPLSALVLLVIYLAKGNWGWGVAWGWDDTHIDPLKYTVGLIDSVIYAFLPWWTTVLLRLVQERTWHHRVAGRSVLIGDIPWVAQSLEEFLSKLFALSYSIAAVNVASGNPQDHLVHRFTHRVVRGGLLAVGRPDGRLNALVSSEATVCLSVNQASSIQNMGVTLESVTIGHTPYKLPLTANAVFLPTTRKRFISEQVLLRQAEKTGAEVEGLSAGSIIGLLSGDALDSPFDEHRAPPPPLCKAGSTVKPLPGSFYGEWMGSDAEHRDWTPAKLMKKQVLLQELYEGRMASLQRFVAFLVMFHAMGKAVQDFWPSVSCGLLGYDMSRTQSIMRIATTASPVSGADVRNQMLELAKATQELWAARRIQRAVRWAFRTKVASEQRELAHLRQVLRTQQ